MCNRVLVALPLHLVFLTLFGCRPNTPSFLTENHGALVKAVVTVQLNEDRGRQGTLSEPELQHFEVLLDSSRGRWEAIGQRRSLLLARDYLIELEWSDGHRQLLEIGRGAMFMIETGYFRMSDTEVEMLFAHLDACIERAKRIDGRSERKR